MKLFIIPQSFSLCLTGYTWFGKASSRSLLKWFVGDHTWHLSLCVVVATFPTPELPAFPSLPCCSWSWSWPLENAACASSCHPQCPPWHCGWRRRTSPLIAAWVPSLLPWTGWSSVTSLLVAYWVVRLRCSFVVYVKMLMCLPWHGFCARHSGRMPVPPGEPRIQRTDLVATPGPETRNQLAATVPSLP
jgi:hypothetical protein